MVNNSTEMWSTIPPISTKRITTSHLISLSTKKKTTTRDSLFMVYNVYTGINDNSKYKHIV